MLKQALRFGFPDVVNTVQPHVSWKEVELLCSSKRSPAPGALLDACPDGYKALVKIAELAGHEAKRSVLTHFLEEGAVRLAMDQVLLNSQGGIDLLPHLLRIGLNPLAPTQQGTSTLLEEARISGTASADIVSSFFARTRAQDWIAEMEDDAKGLRGSP